MRQEYKELFLISLKLDSPKISSPLKRTDLKEIKNLYLRAKEVFLSIPQPDELEVEEMIGIFNKGCKLVGNFFSEWEKGNIKPSDEELDLLMEACGEASDNFNILSEKFSSSFSSESNKKNQEEIARGKKLILEEKRKRAGNDDFQDLNQWKKKIKDLQSQIDYLKSQSNNNDNETKIKDLERQIEKLKNKPLSPNPNVPKRPEISQQPTSPLSSKSGDSGLLVVSCVVIGICFLVLVGYLCLQKKPKKR